MKLPKLTDFNFQNKTVLVRVDFDVPLRQAQGKLLVEDESRIKAVLPTIEYLLKNQARVILLGHLGRPEGKVMEELKMTPVVDKVKELFAAKLHITNPKIALKIQDFPVYILSENLWLLENLRFFSGEEKNDDEFAKSLSLLGDFYVNEAFAASHREHASIVGITKFLPHCAGFNFIKEVENLSKVLGNSQKPLVFIIGGAKPETKLPLVEGLAAKADFVLVGGLLPKFSNIQYQISNIKNVLVAKLAADGLDIDAGSIKKFIEAIQTAGTIVWNGPMGKFEVPEGARGTKETATAIAESSAFKVVGGGDTIAALNKYKLLSKIDFVSLGGGAMLEFLAKGTLPGIQAISNQSSAIRQKYTED